MHRQSLTCAFTAGMTAPHSFRSTVTAAPTFRHRLELIGFRLIQRLCRMLGPDRAGALSGWLWRMIAPLNERHKRAAGISPAPLPQLSEADRDALRRKMWDNLGRTFAEGFLIDEIMADPERIAFDEGARRMLEALGRGPVVMVSMHYANWEVGVPCLAREGHRIAGVYKRIMNPLVDAFVRDMRLRHYAAGLEPRSPTAARFLLKTLSNGTRSPCSRSARRGRGQGAVLQAHGAEHGFSGFCGAPARAPLFVAHAVRLEGARFIIKAIEIPVAQSDDKEADILAATAALQAEFERVIRARPELWMWAHRRWISRVQEIRGASVG